MLALAGFLIACTPDKKSEPRHVTRLDRDLAGFSHLPAERQTAIADSLAPIIRAMFTVMGRQYDGSPRSLQEWAESDIVKWFQPPVDSIYPDITEIERDLGHILSRARVDSLEIPDLEYATVVWGIGRPMVRMDSILLIALNHYLGADFEGYSNWEAYRRAQKTPDQLPYDLAAVIVATQYPFDSAGKTPTLLDWMLYEGALAEARMRLVPDATAACALGFTQEQYEFLENNSGQMWQEMAARRMLYDTDPTLIDRMIASAPASPLLGGKAPGRTGRYIGYAIVRAYLRKHPDTSLRQLLNPSFYTSQKTLIESGYSG